MHHRRPEIVLHSAEKEQEHTSEWQKGFAMGGRPGLAVSVLEDRRDTASSCGFVSGYGCRPAPRRFRFRARRAPREL